MTWTLLTNDDGVDSPALPPLAEALAGISDVRVVAPDRERSWIGKAITRYEPVTVKEIERDGVTMLACSGYPADGVQLGIHGLFDTEPGVVVSGINLGFNHGTGFMMSSGTVGAAVEGWVSGIPALAFSTGANGVDWNEWRRHALSPAAAPDWRRLAEVCAGLTDRIQASGLLRHTDVVSVNLPFDARPDTERRVTSIARVGYDRLFRHVGEGIFVHDFGGGFREFDVLQGTDVDAAQDGVISITPICMPQSSVVPDEMRTLLEG